MEPGKKRQESEQEFPNLHQATEAGDIRAVADFLRRGIDVGELDSRGAPALQIAAARGYLEIARLLVHHGADVNYLIEGGGTPLWAAARCLRPKLVEFLVSKGANPNKIGNGGLSPLHFPLGHAVTELREQLACIRILVANGAEVNARSSLGVTPLMKAAWCGNTEAVAELLRLGAVPALRDNSGRTAAMMAFEHGHDELANLLKPHADTSEAVDQS